MHAVVPLSRSDRSCRLSRPRSDAEAGELHARAGLKGLQRGPGDKHLRLISSQTLPSAAEEPGARGNSPARLPPITRRQGRRLPTQALRTASYRSLHVLQPNPSQGKVSLSSSGGTESDLKKRLRKPSKSGPVRPRTARCVRRDRVVPLPRGAANVEAARSTRALSRLPRVRERGANGDEERGDDEDPTGRTYRRSCSRSCRCGSAPARSGPSRCRPAGCGCSSSGWR